MRAGGSSSTFQNDSCWNGGSIEMLSERELRRIVAKTGLSRFAQHLIWRLPRQQPGDAKAIVHVLPQIEKTLKKPRNGLPELVAEGSAPPGDLLANGLHLG